MVARLIAAPAMMLGHHQTKSAIHHGSSAKPVTQRATPISSPQTQVAGPKAGFCGATDRPDDLRLAGSMPATPVLEVIGARAARRRVPRLGGSRTSLARDERRVRSAGDRLRRALIL